MVEVDADEAEHLAVESSKKGQNPEPLASPVTVTVVIRRGTNPKLAESQVTSCGARNAKPKITTLEQNGALVKIEEDKTFTTDRVPAKASEDETLLENEANIETSQMIVTAPAEQGLRHQGQDNTGRLL